MDYKLDENSLLILIQEILRKKPCLLVGTGLSLSMGLPGMDKLLNQLKSNIPNYYSSNPKLEGEWNNCVDMIAQHGFEAGLCKLRISDLLLQKIINETACFVNREDETLRNNLLANSKLSFPFAKLLKYLVDSLPPTNPIIDIITPNYDHVIEYACDKIGIRCCTGFSGSLLQKFSSEEIEREFYISRPTVTKKRHSHEFLMQKKVRLLKPHGSLWWQKIDQAVFQYHDTIPNSRRIIITPGITKYESSLTESVMNYHREKANSCIRNSNAIFIFGYGFNDGHLHTVLLERLSEGVPCFIMAKHLTPSALKIIKDHPNILAIEKHKDSGVNWFYQNEMGKLDLEIWDLNVFNKKVI